jgi:hypothetical protein
MNMQKIFQQSENKAVFVFVSIAIVAHFAILWLLGVV